MSETQATTTLELGPDTIVDSSRMHLIIGHVAGLTREEVEKDLKFKVIKLTPEQAADGIEALALGYKAMRHLYEDSPPEVYARYYQGSWDMIEAAFEEGDPEKIAAAFENLEYDLAWR